MFAIVEIKGKQYKVGVNDTIEVDRLKEEKGKVTFDKVLLYAKDDKNVEVGHPYVNGATVEAEILDNTRGKKIRVFKMKSKKRYSKTIGHRTNLSVIQIKDIKVSGKKTVKDEIVKEEPKKTTKTESKAKTEKPAEKKTSKKEKTA